jgi:peptide/nickel transport system permease protein
MERMELSDSRPVQPIPSVEATPRRRSIWRIMTADPLVIVGGLLATFVVLVALLAPVLAPEGYTQQNLQNRRATPSWEEPLGTDGLGRSMLNRIIWGARISLTAGGASLALGLIFGVSLGLISAYFGGKIDMIAMRLVDMMLALPFILWAIVVVSALGPSLMSVVIAVAVWTVPSYARLVRSQALAVRENLYVEAARATGVQDGWIMLRHILPNVAGPIIVQAFLTMDAAILAEAGLSFLGLGVPLPNPSWGAMLLEGREYMRSAPHVSIFPGLAIVITVLGFNLLGDGLRDILDPRSGK